jgi:hypothetical protein
MKSKENPNRVEPWTVTQLENELQTDLQSCHTSLERSMTIAICGKEIREKAIEFSKIRKLTPGEIAIAQKYGYIG